MQLLSWTKHSSVVEFIAANCFSETIMIRLLSIFFFTVLISAPVLAEPLINTSAKQAIVIDYETGTVLMEKNADEKMPTSSMSKVMTMYLIFDALKKGDLQLDDKFLVSEKAWRKGGSKMFVEVDKYVKVEDLIRGVIVQSGNDATIVLAEGLAGSEQAFAEAMMSKASELGMVNSNFVNASGWPDPNHYSTSRDLAALGRSMIVNFPEYYPYYAEQEFTFNNITQRNRNPLLYRNIGADGIKTGHTEAGGFGLIGSGGYAGRRVVLVVNGLKDEKQRAQESAKLLEWGLKRFENHKVLTAGEVVESAKVIMGKSEAVEAVLNQDITLTIPKIALKDFKVIAHFTEPLIAPVKKGQEIGTLEIEIPYLQKIQKPLYASEDVEELGLFSGGFTKMKLFLSGGVTANQ